MKIKNITYISIFIALITIGAHIKINFFLVPFTLQLQFIILSSFILGSKKSFLTVLIYVFLGLIGFPVFTNGGGIIYLFQPTFGFLIGFIISSFFLGYLVEKNKISFKNYLIFGILGIIIIYLVATPYLYLISNFVLKTQLSFEKIMILYVLPFIIKDIIFVFIASIIALRLQKQTNY